MAALQRLALRGTPKATKAAARYTPAGGAERCGMCRHYVPSSSCARIEGPVSAAGWCQLYSQQVTWRPRAGQAAGGGVPAGLTLDLSFMTPGTLDPRITFARASTGTYFDASGTLQTATTNTPRWDYDPVTHALNGLLIEEARTNALINSADAGNASWLKGNITVAAPTVTSNQTTAPDGTLSAARVVFPQVTGAGAVSSLFPLSTAAAVQAYSWSVWLKGSAGGEQLYIYMNQGAAAYFRQRITLTTAWQRFSITATLTALTWNFTIGCDLRDASQTTTPAQTIFVWGAQVEVGAFPTSYIPTTAASVTRAQELCTAPTTGWFMLGSSSLMADFMTPNLAQQSRDACAITDGTTTNRLALRPLVAGTGISATVTSISGASTVSASLGLFAANTSAKMASSWNGATNLGCLNAAPVVSTSVGLPPALNVLTIGNALTGSAFYLNGWVRRIRYWPRALTNAELQSVTT